MKVSLCGPHSFETSTLPPAVVEEVLSGAASPPLSRMNSYFVHHVGSCELFWAVTFAPWFAIQRLNPTNPNSPRIARRCLRVMKFLLCQTHSTLCVTLRFCFAALRFCLSASCAKGLFHAKTRRR